MRMFLCLLLVVSAANGSQAGDVPPGIRIFVATNGNDAWSGTVADPNAANSDGPMATLEGARDRIRDIRKAGPLPTGGVEVVVRGGTYALSQTLQLGEADSGTVASPIVYRAADSERVLVLGGRLIGNFAPYKGDILKADVAAAGFKGVRFRQLFFDGRRQSLARYPDFDPQHPTTGGWAYVEGQHVPIGQTIAGESKRVFQYKEQDARQWSQPEEGEVFVFPRYNWYNSIVPIAAVDREQRTITLRRDAVYAVRPADRYYVQNLFEELDAPGEWYLDQRTETLYFWPPTAMDGKAVYAPIVRTLIALGPGTSHVAFRGFVLECCDGNAVTLDGAVDCLIAGNTIRNVGDFNGSGVTVKGGLRNGVVGNDMSEIGRSGIAITGGDQITLTPAENFADNNYIHHIGVFYKQGVGVELNGVGNRASHNLIHDCPRIGIMFFGNDLVIEYNHIRHVNIETSDSGGIYTGGRDWLSARGSVIRYNFLHDLLGYGQKDGKWVSPYDTVGIYLDDNAGGVDIVGNIVARSIRGLVNLHSARDTLIENNILIDSPHEQILCNGWTPKNNLWVQHLPSMIEKYEAAMAQPAWRRMRNMDVSPAKAVLPNGLLMSGNVVRRNIFYYRDSQACLMRLNRVPLDHFESDENLVYHFGLPLAIECRFSFPSGGEPNPFDTPADKWPAWWTATGHDLHSVVADPLFVDPDKDDYRLKPESHAWKLGFQPIPVEKIGPYADPLRASWPIVEAKGVREQPLTP